MVPPHAAPAAAPAVVVEPAPVANSEHQAPNPSSSSDGDDAASHAPATAASPKGVPKLLRSWRQDREGGTKDSDRDGKGYHEVLVGLLGARDVARALRVLGRFVRRARMVVGLFLPLLDLSFGGQVLCELAAMSISAVGDDIITSLWPRVRGSRRWKTSRRLTPSYSTSANSAL